MTTAAHQARAFWTVGPGRGEIRSEALPRPSDSDVLVRALYSGVSRGTEALVFQARVPPDQYARMRAPFQAGDFPAPVKFGYSSVGIVEQGPPDLIARTVFALYPHQTRYVVPADAVHVLPADVPPARAVLAANLETAVNGVWDAHPQVGDRIAVIGGGTVGCLIAWLLGGIKGCDVELIDPVPARSRVAAALGVGFARPEAARRDADLVVHASGSPHGLELALAVAGFEATIVEMSWYGDQRVALPLGERFHAERLTIKSSQVSHVASAQRSRWDARRRMQLVLALLADPALDAVITGESDFDTLPDVMPQLTTNPGETICHRVKY